MSANDITKKTLFYLENPLIYLGLPPKNKASIPLMLWEYPSFFPYISWSIIEDKNQYFVRRILWDRQDELMPEPRLYGAEALLPQPLWAEIEQSLQSVTLPLSIPAPHVGLDGTRYGLAIQNSNFSVKISWWDVAPPAGWQPLQHWHKQTVTWLEPYLPTHQAIT